MRHSTIDSDAGYLPIILLSGWAGIVWPLVALFVSMAWDLDQSWYDSSPAWLLPLRIALLWPVWGTVQVEDALGWQLGDGSLILVMMLLGILPVMAIATLWSYASSRRQS